MRWYWKVLGGHTHVRVFMNGGKCGDLCFRNEEFEELQAAAESRLMLRVTAPVLIQLRGDRPLITFIPDGYTVSEDGTSITCHTCGMTSFNQNDVKNRYCGKCHKFHESYERDQRS